LDSIQGLNADSTITAGNPVTIFVRITNDTVYSIDALYNRFRLYSPNQATWTPSITIDTSIIGGTIVDTTFYSLKWVPPPGEDDTYWLGQLDATFRDVSSDHDNNPATPEQFGEDSDTVSFAGFANIPKAGVAAMFDGVIWSMSIDSIHEVSAGNTLCIDSVVTELETAPGLSSWHWHLREPDSYAAPDWGGSLCFTIVSCCQGVRGNINLDLQGEIDISDLTYLVGWMFKSGDGPPCILEADVDGNDSHDIADVTALVGYMFKSGPEPAGCPQ
jgi:hypothetical protein